MAYEKTCYLQHVAVHVKDIQWHIAFFKAIGMPVNRVAGDPDAPDQVWTAGGMQLKSATDFEGPEGRLDHLGIFADDLEAALEEAYKWGVEEMPQGHNWFRLPDGMAIEMMQAPRS